MKCEDFKKLIDAYIDGELDNAQAAEMLAHAQECENCENELHLAEMLRDAIVGMDDDIVPPLAAQAAWRNAIKTEARKVRMKKIYKYCGTVAAALIVLVGCVTLLDPFGSDGNVTDTAPTSSGADYTFVAADGNEAAPTAMARTLSLDDEAVHAGMTANVKLCCAEPSKACDTIVELAGEFGGLTDTPSGGESSAYVTAYIPADSIGSFIDALSVAGEVTDSQLSGEGETVTVAITIKIAE